MFPRQTDKALRHREDQGLQHWQDKVQQDNLAQKHKARPLDFNRRSEQDRSSAQDQEDPSQHASRTQTI
jgi:hypothetical protein